MDQRASLLVKAGKYRAFASAIGDPDAAQRILNLAHELEREAMQPDEEDIRTRAYDLWKQAGEPEDRDEEFWLLAEQEFATRTNPRRCELPTICDGEELPNVSPRRVGVREPSRQTMG